jgi:hypothetical protein
MRICEPCNPIHLQLHFEPPRTDDEEHFFVIHDFTNGEFARVGKPREWDELDEILYDSRDRSMVVLGV